MSVLRGAAVAVAVALAGNAVLDLVAVWHSPIGLQDDAYYYAIVARNLAATGASTFDGVNATNGYHPLWLWLETLQYAMGVGRLSTTGQAVAIVALQYGVLGIAFLAALRETRPRVRAALLLGAAILVYPPHLRIFAAGMESTLVLPLGAAFLFALWDGRPRRAGLLAVLLVLARLDTMLYVVLPAVLLSTRRARDFAWVLVPPAIALASYLAWNQGVYGHPMPISGMSKSSFPWPHVQLRQLWSVPHELRSLLSFNQLTCLVPLALGPLLVRTPTVRRLAVLGWIQVGSFVLFQRWSKPLEQWYLAPVVALSASIVAVGIVERAGEKWALRSAAALASVVAVYLALGAGHRAPPPQKQAVIDFMETTPEGTVFATTDSGILAFGSERRVLNLDGLINGFPYQEAVRDQHLAAWLREQRARYLIVRVWERAPSFDEPMYRSRIDFDTFAGEYVSYRFWVHSYLYGVDSDALEIGRDEEVWRGPIVMDGDVRSRFVVFAL
jgi:hypothetical protein